MTDIDDPGPQAVFPAVAMLPVLVFAESASDPAELPGFASISISVLRVQDDEQR
jgi:hypothetical protein